MHLLIPLLILTAEPPLSTWPGAIDPSGEEAVEIYRCDFTHQTVAGVTREVDVNYDRWPDHWTRRRGHEYPTYVKMEIAAEAESEANAGNRVAGTLRAPSAGNGAQSAPTTLPACLRVELDGGAAAAFTPPIEVNPRFSYRVEGRVRIEGLQHDEAYLSVAFRDGEGRLLEQHQSPRLRKATAWRTLQIGPLTPHGEEVRTAVIGLHVTPTDQADLRGVVWFDDLGLARLPRMALSANSLHHVYTDPGDIVLTCEVSGVRARNPELRFRVRDVFGRLMDEETRQLLGEPLERTAGPARRSVTYGGALSWTPNIRQPGFYRIEAEMRTAQDVAYRRHLTLVVTRDRPASDSRLAGETEFGWSLPGDQEPLSLEAQASLVRLAGVQWIKLPAWFDAHDQRRADRLARFVERVEQEGITVVGVLDQPPSEARPLFADEGVLPIASVFVDKDAWQTAVDPVMTRLTPIIRWWQLGADHDASFLGFPNLEFKIDEIRQRLGRFGQKVQIGFAWPWLEDHPPQIGKSPPWGFLSYTHGGGDPGFTSAELTRYLSGLPTAGPRRWVPVQPLPRDEYDLTTRARDLVERMLAAKMSGADVAFIPRPFDPNTGLMTTDGAPGELFLPWRTTALALAGGEFLGSIETPNGSRNYVFSRGEESVMVVWNDRPVQETLYLGEGVRQIDLWDRETRPPRSNGRHTLEIGPLPTIITGVHTAIARWRMSFQFENPQLASVFGRPQRLEYRVQNPFPQGVSGRVVFHTPEVWNVERASPALRLAPGELRKDLLRVTLRPTASSGQHQVRVDFEITADRDYRFSVWRTIDVGLGDVAVELNTRLDEEGRLVVEQQFINRAPEPVSFLCQLFAPGRPRIRRPALDLHQGRTTITYHLPDGAELVGQTLILRAEEIHGDRALNYRFEAK